MDANERNEWRQADELFTGLFELDDSKRALALAKLELAPSVRAKLNVLLANTSRGHNLLDAKQPGLLLWHTAGLSNASATEQPGANLDPLIGRCIGDWRLIGLLGRGGMAAVYRAQRTGQDYQHEAAVKLLGLSLRSASGQRRFRRERQILASLQHPNIASLVDGGVADDGTPYLVMGLVHGQRIDEYCDAHDLPVRARVRLIQQVCSAVAVAHRQLVVHRDIKPGNILVDESGHATLLDFGIAHMLEDEDTGARTATRAFTPDYSAPEQQSGEQGVGTAVDIYGLGAVLHRLATGIPPQRQADTSPVLPSKVAARNGRHDAAVELRGDLDAILIRAMDQEPAERYASADALSADLGGWLDHRPVVARRAGGLKRFGKLLRRNRVASGAVALALVALIVAIATLVLSRNRLEQRADVLQAMVEFQSGMLQDVDPNQVGEHLRRATTKALQEYSALSPSQRESVLAEIDFTGTAARMLDQAVLSRAVTESRKRFATQPKVLAMMLQSLGASYRDLYLFDKAEPLLIEAMELFRDTLGPGDRLTLGSMREHAALFPFVRNDEKALRFTTKTLALHRQYLGNDDPETALAMMLHAGVLAQSDAPKAETLLRTALPLIEAHYGHDSSETSLVLDKLAVLMQMQGRLDEAEEAYKEALQITTKLHGPESGNAIDIRFTLVWLGQPHGHSAQLHEGYMELLAISTREFGEYHPRTLKLLNRAAAWPRIQGDYATAEPMQRQAYEGFLRTMGSGNLTTLICQINLADIYLHLGKLEEAEVLLQDAVSRANKTTWEFYVPKIEFLLGLVKLQAGDFKQAESWLQKSWDNAAAKGFTGRQHNTAETMVTLYNKIGNTEKREYWQAQLDLLDTDVATTTH